MKSVITVCLNKILNGIECKNCIRDEYNLRCPKYKPVRLYTLSVEQREQIQNTLEAIKLRQQRETEDRERLLRQYAGIMGNMPYNMESENS